jgi:hypothetical protein
VPKSYIAATDIQVEESIELKKMRKVIHSI